METFQNVDEWLVSTDVSGVLTSSWKEELEYGFVGGLDDDSAAEGYLTSLPCPTGGPGCHNATDPLSTPLQGKHWSILFLALSTQKLAVTVYLCKNVSVIITSL